MAKKTKQSQQSMTVENKVIQKANNGSHGQKEIKDKLMATRIKEVKQDKQREWRLKREFQEITSIRSTFLKT